MRHTPTPLRRNAFAAFTALCLNLFACGTAPGTGSAEDNWHQPLFQGLGGVDLPISTNSAEAQQYFNQGLALAFAFNHAAADLAFNEATIYDPNCALCYWGSALVLGPNVNAPMDPANAERAFVLAERARTLAANATPLEQALTAALQARYQPEAPADRSALDNAYADAMRQVAASHPDNANVLALTAEALMDLHPWDFWDSTGNSRPWTTEITDTIETALALDPNHVGAIHLYIHAVEQSNTPQRAEPYADKLADLAPTAGHLVHMPAHIYMRVGRYHDATLNNMRATEADDAFIRACRSNSPIYLAGYMPHNWHFGWVSAAIEGWRSQAYALAEGTAATLSAELLRAPGMAVAQHFLMQPTFAHIRFSDWDAILATPAPDDDLLYARAVHHYARGYALANLDDLDGAAREHRALTALRDAPQMAELTFFNRDGAAPLLAIADRVLSAERLNASGDSATAIRKLKEAVALEDALPYTEPPEWFFPVRHALGELQLATGDAAGAETTYREDLAIMPENGWALRGLQNALAAQNQPVTAVAERFQQAWQHAEVSIDGSRL